MKLTTVTHVSVDGVMQGLGGPDEDGRGGFERGGWALAKPAGELQVHGSGSLVRWLLENQAPAVCNGHAGPEHVTGVPHRQ